MKNILHYALVSVVLAGSATSGYCAATTEHVFSNEDARNFRTVMSIASDVKDHESEIENLAVDIANVLSLMDEWEKLPENIKDEDMHNRTMNKYFKEVRNFLIGYAQKQKQYDFIQAAILPPREEGKMGISKKEQDFQDKVNLSLFYTFFEGMKKFIPLIYLWNQIPENIKNVYRAGKFGIGGSKQQELPFVFTIEGLKRPLDDYCTKHPELAAGNYRYQ